MQHTGMQHYSKPLGFIRNKKVTAEIISLDPVKDHCRIVHLMTGYEFPWDVVRALEVALMKTFCSPRISGYYTAPANSENMVRKDMMIQPCLLQNLCKTVMMEKEENLPLHT